MKDEKGSRDTDNRTSLEKVLGLPSARESIVEDIAEGTEEIEDPALETIRVEALATFRALVEEGLNAEPRYADRYLETAAEVLKVAVDCVKASRRMTLDREKIDLERRKVEAKERVENAPDDGEDASFDRNRILQIIRSAIDGTGTG